MLQFLHGVNTPHYLLGLYSKLYEDQRATVIDILSENSKREYPKSVTELLRLEEKRFVQGVCYFINKIP
jgi:hypothetical protein